MASDAWKWKEMDKFWRMVGLGGPSKGAATASKELIDSNPNKNAKYHAKEKRKVNFIYLAYNRSQFGIKRCKM